MAPFPSTVVGPQGQNKVTCTNANNGSNGVNYRILRKFVPHSKLRAYLARKRPQSNFAYKDTATLHEVLLHLKEVISDEKLYDANNASIIMADQELEEALDVKALHLTEIRDQVLKQLSVVTPQVTMEPLVGVERSGLRLPNEQNSLGGPRKSCTPGLSANNTSLPSNLVLQSSASAPSSSNQMVNSPSSSGSTTTRTCPILLTNITPQTKFRTTSEFRKVLDLVEGVDPQQEVFTYEELTKHLSAYILTRKDKFFDARNIKVALVGDDPLAKAFGVKAFHRSQVTGLLRRQLLLYEPPKQNGNTSITNDELKTESVKAEIKQEPVDDDVKQESVQVEEGIQGSSSAPIKSEQIVSNETNACDSNSDVKNLISQSPKEQVVESSINKESRVRKRSNSGEGPSKRARQQRYSLEIRFDSDRIGYSSDGEETIYSEQGYETVAVCNIYNNTSESDDDDEEEEEEEEEDRNGDASENTDFTEYEVDSDAYADENEDVQGASSAGESDIDDVCIILEDSSEGMESWADVDSSDDFDSSDFELSNFDPEIGPRASEHWSCLSCNNRNPPLIRYCHKCWQERKGWLPDRPKPRRKRKRNHLNPGANGKNKKTSRREQHSSDDNSGSSQESSAKVDSGYSQTMDDEEDGGVADKDSKDTTDEEIELVVNDMTDKVSGECGNVKHSSEDRKIPAVTRSHSSSSLPASEAETTSSSVMIKSVSSAGTSQPDMLCNFCLSRDKNAGIIHGSIIHQICCYPCARRLYKRKQPCPMCRRRIEKISRIIVG